MATNFKEIEEKLRERKSKVVLSNGDPKTLSEAIHRLFVLREKTYAVYNSGGRKKQCEPGRHRSIEDLFHVVKALKPNVKFKQLYDIVDDLRKRRPPGASYTTSTILGYHFCNTTRREVHWPGRVNVTEKEIREHIGNKNIELK